MRFIVQVGGVIAFIVTLAAFWIEIGVQRKEAITEAWAIISAADKNDVGNIGVSSALELLADRNVSLMDVTLPGAMLRKVELEDARLGRAEFGIDCANSRLRQEPNTKMAEWLQRVSDEEGAKDLKWKKEDCRSRQTDLGEARLSGSNLIYSSFVGATLKSANLSSTCLFSADFRGANLDGVDFSGAVLRHADFRGALLMNTTFSKADLGKAKFDAALCGQISDKEFLVKLCSADDLKGMIGDAIDECIVTNSQGVTLPESCAGKNYGIVTCTEEHGYRLE